MSAGDTGVAPAMRIELRLAAIITLLSSLTLHGATSAKLAALRDHLEAAALCDIELDPHLRQALEDVFAQWLEVECYAQSEAEDEIAPALAPRLLH